VAGPNEGSSSDERGPSKRTRRNSPASARCGKQAEAVHPRLQPWQYSPSPQHHSGNSTTSTTTCPVAVRAVPWCPVESERLGGRSIGRPAPSGRFRAPILGVLIQTEFRKHPGPVFLSADAVEYYPPDLAIFGFDAGILGAKKPRDPASRHVGPAQFAALERPPNSLTVDHNNGLRPKPEGQAG